jgi:hypothetical protein
MLDLMGFVDSIESANSVELAPLASFAEACRANKEACPRLVARKWASAWNLVLAAADPASLADLAPAVALALAAVAPVVPAARDPL